VTYEEDTVLTPSIDAVNGEDFRIGNTSPGVGMINGDKFSKLGVSPKYFQDEIQDDLKSFLNFEDKGTPGLVIVSSFNFDGHSKTLYKEKSDSQNCILDTSPERINRRNIDGIILG
jgi:hypothetical protein